MPLQQARHVNEHGPTFGGETTSYIHTSTHQQQYLSQSAEPEYKLETAITQACQRLFPTWALGSPLPEPRHLRTTHLQRKEKSFARSMHSRISDLWRTELVPACSTDPTLLPTSRVQAYTQMAQYDLQRRDLFRPAVYIHASSSVCTSALLRLRTQTSCHIPAHCKLGTMSGGRVSYKNGEARAPARKRGPSLLSITTDLSLFTPTLSH
jgi:hypothetical protein